MITYYVLRITHYKGLQSGQIAPLAGLFGRGSGVIWPGELFGRFVILRSDSETYLCYKRVNFHVSNDVVLHKILTDKVGKRVM